MDVPERRQWRGSDFAAGKKVPSNAVARASCKKTSCFGPARYILAKPLGSTLPELNATPIFWRSGHRRRWSRFLRCLMTAPRIAVLNRPHWV